MSAPGLGLTRDNPHTIAFVMACMHKAISREEGRNWLLQTMGAITDYPTYLLELYERWDDPPILPLGAPKNVPCPFPMERCFNALEQTAIRGIGYSRGLPRSRRVPALATRVALVLCPSLRREFDKTFGPLDPPARSVWARWPEPAVSFDPYDHPG